MIAPVFAMLPPVNKPSRLLARKTKETSNIRRTAFVESILDKVSEQYYVTYIPIRENHIEISLQLELSTSTPSTITIMLSLEAV